MNNIYCTSTKQGSNYIRNDYNTITGLISSYNLQDEEILKLREQVKILTKQNRALKLLLKLNS